MLDHVSGGTQDADVPWRDWLLQCFPEYVPDEFAFFHEEFWDWLDAIVLGDRPRPFVAIWSRDAGKSVSAELAVVRIGARNLRRYVWYVSEVQEQADKHVETIASMLESPRIALYHPELSEPRLSRFGRPRGWRRNRIWTHSGLTIDALGLDVAARGARVEENRPGFIVFDDIDGKYDSPNKVAKKIETLTTSLLPARSQDAAVLFIQNLIHDNSIASQLVDGRAEFLSDRIVSGPHPALLDFEYQQVGSRFIITNGKPTWSRMDVDVCQDIIDTAGITSFKSEYQHDVEAPPGGIWDHIEFQHCEYDEVPEIIRGSVWVDPAVTSTDESDCMAMQADGIGIDNKLYRFYSFEQIISVTEIMKRAILKCLELGFDRVGVETDQGGDTWEVVYDAAWNELIKEGAVRPETLRPGYAWAKAGAGHGSKVHRNQQMVPSYERGEVVHVIGTHQTLERALRRFPKTKPYDLADASYWAWYDLTEPEKGNLDGFDQLGHVEGYKSKFG